MSDKSIEQLTAENELLAAKVEALEGELSKGKSSAKALTEQRSSEPPPKFKLGNKEYQFTAGGFRIGDDVHLAVNAVKDQKLLALIVEQYPGLVKAL